MNWKVFLHRSSTYNTIIIIFTIVASLSSVTQEKCTNVSTENEIKFHCLTLSPACLVGVEVPFCPVLKNRNSVDDPYSSECSTCAYNDGKLWLPRSDFLSFVLSLRCSPPSPFSQEAVPDNGRLVPLRVFLAFIRVLRLISGELVVLWCRRVDALSRLSHGTTCSTQGGNATWDDQTSLKTSNLIRGKSDIIKHAKKQ